MLTRIVRSWSEMSAPRKMGISVLLLAFLAFAVWAAAPLFYNRQVNEAFPAAQSGAMAQAQDEAMQEAAMQPQAAPSAQDAMAAKPPPTAAPAIVEPATAVPIMAEPTAAVPPTAAPTEPLALRSGSFTRVDAIHRAEGAATIYKLADGKLVLRLENFKATNGPDLFVGLSGHPQPRSPGEAHDQGYIQLAALKGNEGNQNYELPSDLDLSKFKSVVIYCRAFNVVFSTAELKGV
jgi:hypothetical protein